MKISATELRQNLYRIIDTVLETGEPVEIERKTGTVRIVADRVTSIWDRLIRDNYPAAFWDDA